RWPRPLHIRRRLPDSMLFPYTTLFRSGTLGENVFWWSLWAIVAAAGLFLIVRTVHFSRRFVPRLVAIVIALLMIVPAGAFAYRICRKSRTLEPNHGRRSCAVVVL